MADAFVKSFNRYCMYVHDRPDAQIVLSQLAIWSENYNEMPPPKGMRCCGLGFLGQFRPVESCRLGDLAFLPLPDLIWCL